MAEESIARYKWRYSAEPFALMHGYEGYLLQGLKGLRISGEPLRLKERFCKGAGLRQLSPCRSDLIDLISANDA